MTKLQIMRNVPLNIGGINCCIITAEFATLKSIYVKVSIPHRVGQKVMTTDEWYVECDHPNYITVCSYVNTESFPRWAWKHELYNYIKQSLHFWYTVNLDDAFKASKELLIIMQKM